MWMVLYLASPSSGERVCGYHTSPSKAWIGLAAHTSQHFLYYSSWFKQRSAESKPEQRLQQGHKPLSLLPEASVKARAAALGSGHFVRLLKPEKESNPRETLLLFVQSCSSYSASPWKAKMNPPLFFFLPQWQHGMWAPTVPPPRCGSLHLQQVWGAAGLADSSSPSLLQLTGRRPGGAARLLPEATRRLPLLAESVNVI